MPQKQESRLQRATRSALEHEIGGVWFKSHGGIFQEPGIEDLLGCVRGLYVGVELKIETGRLRAAQRLRMRRIIRDGGAYIIARSPEQAVYRVLKHLIKNAKATKNEIARMASSGGSIRLQTRTHRHIRATADGKDSYDNLPRHKAVARRIS